MSLPAYFELPSQAFFGNNAIQILNCGPAELILLFYLFRMGLAISLIATTKEKVSIVQQCEWIHVKVEYFCLHSQKGDPST